MAELKQSGNTYPEGLLPANYLDLGDEYLYIGIKPNLTLTKAQFEFRKAEAAKYWNNYCFTDKAPKTPVYPDGKPFNLN